MGKIRRRQRCPECGSLDVVKWGVQCGHQRYKCTNCGTSFTPRRKDIESINRFVWFRKWVLGKQALSDISKSCKCSERQLRRWFNEYLDRAPDWVIQRRKRAHILIDGTWLDKDHCLIIYRDHVSKSTLFYRFSKDENEYEIIKDLQVFKQLKLNIESFTTDGADPIIRAIKYAYPYKVRQRCIVHIERECLTWLTQHPKTAAGITLRRLVRQISYIKTNNDKLFWLMQLNKWYEDYGEFLNEKTVNKETGEITYTHDSVRRAYIHIHRAQKNMFKYLEFPGVPNNTNGLESFFGHLKDNLRIHRGMSIEHRENFIKWYLFFANEKKKTNG